MFNIFLLSFAKYFIFNKLLIETESNGVCKDRHYGRYGNFYTALLFDTILEHTNDIEHDGYYIKDLDLISKIKERSTKPSFVRSKIPCPAIAEEE